MITRGPTPFFPSTGRSFLCGMSPCGSCSTYYRQLILEPPSTDPRCQLATSAQTTWLYAHPDVLHKPAGGLFKAQQSIVPFPESSPPAPATSASRSSATQLLHLIPAASMPLATALEPSHHCVVHPCSNSITPPHERLRVPHLSGLLPNATAHIAIYMTTQQLLQLLELRFSRPSLLPASPGIWVGPPDG